MRANKDLDVVQVGEALTHEYSQRFWQYIEAGGYEGASARADTRCSIASRDLPPATKRFCA